MAFVKMELVYVKIPIQVSTVQKGSALTIVQILIMKQQESQL